MAHRRRRLLCRVDEVERQAAAHSGDLGQRRVHGYNNVVGATLFPHNIGLGAARNPDLVRRIGAATAIEMRVTGLDWTFAPMLAVVRDDRWGRVYEGFGETPEIATSYAAPLIEGLHCKIGDKDWLRSPHIIATAKHFLGDGGTYGGKDQGEAQMPEAQLRDLFSPPYLPALDAGVQFPNAQSIWEGIDAEVKAAGGSAIVSVEGRYSRKPDVAIVIFGEDPYAEFQGDRPDVGYDDAKNLALLRSRKAAGVPMVSVFLSGHAMWVNPFLNASDAFVAAWLPGSEGGGIADMLFGKQGGGIADMLFGKADFRGKLPYSWPKASD